MVWGQTSRDDRGETSSQVCVCAARTPEAIRRSSRAGCGPWGRQLDNPGPAVDDDNCQFVYRITQKKSSTALHVSVSCVEESLFSPVLKMDREDGRVNGPGPWICNGKSSTCKRAAVMSWFVQLMAGSRSKKFMFLTAIRNYQCCTVEVGDLLRNILACHASTFQLSL